MGRGSRRGAVSRLRFERLANQELGIGLDRLQISQETPPRLAASASVMCRPVCLRNRSSSAARVILESIDHEFALARCEPRLREVAQEALLDFDAGVPGSFPLLLILSFPRQHRSAPC